MNIFNEKILPFWVKLEVHVQLLIVVGAFIVGTIVRSLFV